MSIATIPFIPVEPEYPPAPPVSQSNPAATLSLEFSYRAAGAKRKSTYLSFQLNGTDASSHDIARALERLSETFCGRCSARREACQCADGPVAPAECS